MMSTSTIVIWGSVWLSNFGVIQEWPFCWHPIEICFYYSGCKWRIAFEILEIQKPLAANVNIKGTLFCPASTSLLSLCLWKFPSLSLLLSPLLPPSVLPSHLNPFPNTHIQALTLNSGIHSLTSRHTHLQTLTSRHKHSLQAYIHSPPDTLTSRHLHADTHLQTLTSIHSHQGLCTKLTNYTPCADALTS